MFEQTKPHHVVRGTPTSEKQRKQNKSLVRITKQRGTKRRLFSDEAASVCGSEEEQSD